MSLKAVAHVLNAQWDDSTQFLVAIGVANYSGPDGICFAKYETLAKFTCLSKRTVGDAIRKLIDARQLTAERRQRANGTLGVYVLAFPGMADPRYDAKREADDDISDGQNPPRGNEADSAVRKGKQLPRSNQRTTSTEDSNQEDAASRLVAVAFNEWNDLAKAEGLPIAEKLTEDRKRKLYKRLKDSGIEGWRRALAAIPRAKFLVGEARPRDGEAPFRAHIDFVLQSRSFQKLVEGGYGQDRKAKVQPAAIAADYQNKLRTDERFARTMAHQWTQDPDRWPPEAGPPPGQPGCVLPFDVQANVVRGMSTGAPVLDDEVPL